MQQGSHRKSVQERRRRFFLSQASRGGQAPPGQAPPQGTVHNETNAAPAAPVNETRPGHVGTIPPAQIQPHQVVHTSGLPGTQPAQGASTFAPQSGQQVPVTPGPPSTMAQPPRLPQTGQVPATPRADVTVILYSSGQSPQLLAQQLQALRRQSVQPAAIQVHVDGPQGHDEQSLMRMSSTCRTQSHLGRHFRLALAREVTTGYVLLLEEGTIPGQLWLERALQALMEADNEELAFGPAVVACAGVLQGSQDPADAHPIGAELPRNEESAVVDYGRGGWLCATEFIRVVEGLPRVGSSSDSLGILMAVAAREAGVPTVVMDYGLDQQHWGSLAPVQWGVDQADAAGAFSAYIEMGWNPELLGKGLPHHEPAPQQPTSSHLPAQAKPSEFVERKLGNTVMRERVLAPHEQTPDPNKGKERVLSGGEQTPPPASSRTEQIVPSSPPPESSKTERLVASQPPKSQTGQ